MKSQIVNNGENSRLIKDGGIASNNYGTRLVVLFSKYNLFSQPILLSNIEINV